MADFFQDYFLSPIQSNGWFNPVNTIVYSIILVIAVYLVYRLLRRMDVAIDNRFWLAILPFIVWGSTTRVLHDAAFAGILTPALNAFYSSNIFPTPGSYFITFTLAIVVLLSSLGIQRMGKIPYWKSMFAAGSVLVAINLMIIPWSNPIPLLAITGMTLLWTGLFVGIRWLFQHTKSLKDKYRSVHERLLSNENIAILSAHFLDASATVVALVYFGYVEQHVVPRMLFPLFGPYAMFLLKIVVVLPALWIIDRYAEDPQMAKFLKIVVFILGMAPGLRNLVRLAAEV